jgi:hypothetical protein
MVTNKQLADPNLEAPVVSDGFKGLGFVGIFVLVLKDTALKNLLDD